MAVRPEVQAILDRNERLAQQVDQRLKGGNGTANGDRQRTKDAVLGVQGAAPYARKGENPMTSRGFQFQRLLGTIAGCWPEEDAKVELDLCRRLGDIQVREGGHICHHPQHANGKSFLAPFSADELVSETVVGPGAFPEDFRQECKSLTQAGANAADPDALQWLMTKAFRGDVKTAQSWMDETLGGALVAPPAFGELIQLFRNKDALINAGCRVVPLPPSGRLKYPRQTSPTTGYWVGEGTSTGGITASNFNTGTLLLEGKKCAALVTLNNELIRFASPATEAILRADMTKTLSLTVDYAGLQGVGSTTQPLGILGTPGVVNNSANITTPPAVNTGGLVSWQDLYQQFVAAVEANNGEFQGWILRPELFYAFVGARAAVYNGSTTVQQGQFIADQFRSVGQGFGPILAGFKATTTPQVSNTRVQGTNKALTYLLGGQWDDYVMAMFGSIEFAQAWQGDTIFPNDQTSVRAILTVDMAPRHPGVFVYADGLQLAAGP